MALPPGSAYPATLAQLRTVKLFLSETPPLRVKAGGEGCGGVSGRVISSCVPTWGSPLPGGGPGLRDGREASVDLLTECPLVSSQGCRGRDRRSRDRGRCARGPGRRGLHRGRNHRLLLGGQNDVGIRHRQRGRRCLGRPGGYSAVSGSSRAIPVVQSHPGHHWGPGVPGHLASWPSQCREEDRVPDAVGSRPGVTVCHMLRPPKQRKNKNEVLPRLLDSFLLTGSHVRGASLLSRATWCWGAVSWTEPKWEDWMLPLPSF